jgi:hypothetical protein
MQARSSSGEILHVIHYFGSETLVSGTAMEIYL